MEICKKITAVARFASVALASTLCACAPQDPPAPPVHFTDVGDAAGIDFVHFNGFSGQYYYVETFGSGAAFLDYDGDGRLDLYLANGTYLTGPRPTQPPVNRLYRNAGAGTFADVTAQSGSADPGYGFGVAVADYDADGDPDLFVANYGPNALYRNDQGTFAKAAAGLADPRWGSSAGFLDYDRDGDLDLFVANYVRYALDDATVCQQGPVRAYCQPSAYDPTGDLLYRNDGDTFADVTAATGIALKGKGLGVALADYDRDGDTDIYVANDGTMNFLYANQHSTFAEVGLIAGTRYNEHGHADAGMGVDFGDYDRDGDADLFVTNFAFETNALYRNDGQGQFAVATQRLGWPIPRTDPSALAPSFSTTTTTATSTSSQPTATSSTALQKWIRARPTGNPTRCSATTPAAALSMSRLRWGQTSNGPTPAAPQRSPTTTTTATSTFS